MSVQLRAAAAAAVVAGVMFVIYPLLRPWSDEQGVSGAQALASTAWVATHAAAMVGFVVLPIVLRQVGPRLGSPAGILLITVGSALVLPYYGAEAFGIQAIAQAATPANPELLALIAPLRFGVVQLTFFGLGLAAMAVGGVLQAVRVWRTAPRLRWYAIPLAVGLVTFLPQFYTPAGVRIAHGLVMGLGCLGLVWLLRRRSLDPA